MDYKNITIIGAGNGGYAAAGNLIMRGFNLTIYELPKYQTNLFPLIETGKIKLTGELSGIVSAPNIEVDLEAAVNSADTILIITHAGSHKTIAEKISPFIKDDQLIVVVAGYTGGALCFENIFRKNNVSKKYILAETNTLPYACRRISGEPTIHIKLYVKQILASTFPATFNPFFLEIFRKLYPNVHLVNNVLETGFNNGNPVLNVLPTIFNAGRIDYAKGEYYHFQEGVTPRVSRVIEAIDKERMQIGELLGLEVMPYLERVVKTGYVINNDNWYEMISTSPHLTAKGPDSLEHRYITEDVPYGFTPWYHFARSLNMETKLIYSSIELASSLMGINYFENGRTLKDMGLEGMTVSEIKKYIEKG